MKKINYLLNEYAVLKNDIDLQKLERSIHLKEHIKISKAFLHKLRLYIRDYIFESTTDEIHFFKLIKPKISGDLMFYNAQLSYIVCKSDVAVSIQKSFLKAKLKKLESYKKKNILFYRYYKQGEVFLDDKYFLRGNEQLELFNSQTLLCSDPDFFTSHDMKASVVISNDLLRGFYKNELSILDMIGNEVLYNDIKGPVENNLTWTATKTDLIELVYALKYSGAINGGAAQVKEITESLEIFFDIDLGNFYKTYSEIKSRTKDRSKFLNKLSENLVSRLEQDDSI
jgi:hypothetical protein